MSVGKSKATVEFNAVVYPSCAKCGNPWTAHGECGGYLPSKPIVDYGTVYFRSADRIANALFYVEQLIQSLRRKRMRNL